MNIFELKKNFRCRIEGFCIPITKYKKINPSNQLTVLTTCEDGCDELTQLTYKYIIYLSIGDSNNETWQEITSEDSILYLKGNLFINFQLKKYFS